MSSAEYLRVGVTCALVVLTFATIVTQVFSTLLINRAAPVGESDAMRTLQIASPALIVVGLLCGILAGGSMMFLAWKEARAGGSSAARILGIGGVAALGSTGPLITGIFNSLDPERMGQAGSGQCQWAAIFLVAAWAAWAISSFQDRARRIASGPWSVGARRFDECMGKVRLSRVAACIPAMILVAGLASMFISAVETQFHTFDVAERITAFEGRYHIAKVDWVTDVDVLPVDEYWRVSLSAAWLVGAVHGLTLAGVGLVVFGAFRWARKRYKSPGFGANLLGLAAGIYVFAYARHGLAWVFEDEVIALGMFTLANCGMAILGIIYGSLVAWNILELCSRDDRPRDSKDMMRVILLSGILLAAGPIARLGRRGCGVVRALVYAGLLAWSAAAAAFGGGPWEWLGSLGRYWQLVLTVGVVAVFEGTVHLWRRLHARRSVLADISAIFAACTVAAVVIYILFRESFPQTEDHTTRVAIFLALVITLVAAYSGCLLFPPRSRAWYLRSAVIIVLLALGTTSMVSAMTPTKDHSTIRNMMYEHSAVSKNNLECWRRVYGTGWEMPPPRAPVVTPPDEPLDSPVLNAFRKERPLVIFLIWDACRPDHMSFYGYDRKTTPRLDAMKDRLVRFDNVFSQATATSCSMRHVFTGRYSSRYMLKKTGIGPFFTNEMLAGGYHTMHLNIVGSDFNGISEVAFLRDMPEDLQIRVKVTQAGERLKDTLNQDDLKQWMSRVKRMRAEAGGLKPDRRAICYGEQKPVQKVNMLLDYLDDNQAEGTFAYIHMTDSHYPWKRYDETYEWGDSHEDLYDGAIAHCDRATGQLFDGLKARGLLDKTILIIAADHGTGLGDHGKYAGFHPYYEQIHVPLIMHIPGVKGKRISSLVGLFDIAPMLVNLAAPERLEARNYEAMDLWPLILRGERKAPRVIFGLNSFEDCYYRVGTDSLHYIWRRARGYDDLFNYVKDPHERTRKLLEDTETVNRCRAEMAWFLEQGKGRYLDPLHYRVEDPPDRH
jgi:arylsulfatase A-like enzyme